MAINILPLAEGLTPTPARKSSPHHASLPAIGLRKIYFGQQHKPYVGPGLYVTMERGLPDVDGTIAGGLGSVSKTIPYGVNTPFELDDEHYAGIRTDVISPMFQQIKAANASLENPYQDTGITVQFDGFKPLKPTLSFRLLKREESVPGSDRTITTYMVDSDLFSDINDSYVRSEADEINILHKLTGESQESLKEHIINKGLRGTYRGSAKLAAVYARAVTELMKKYQEANPDSLADQYKFVMINDWNAGYLPAFLDANGMDTMAEVYFVHNTHDFSISEEDAADIGIRQEFLDQYQLIQRGEDEKTGKPYANMSAMDTGMSRAHAQLMATPYAERVIDPESGLGKGKAFTPRLKNAFEAGHVYNIHHVPENEFDPFKSESLTKDGFVQLEGNGEFSKVTPEQLHTFKQANKAALQKKLGLTEDPNAFITGFLLSRLDPMQKGIDLALRNVEALLDQHPDLQLVMVGPQKAPNIKARLEGRFAELMEKYPGRFHGSIEMVKGDDRFPYAAGSDAILFPSTYEPYGLTQLEAARMGAIPIATNVDGLKNTVLDPVVNTPETSDEHLTSLVNEFKQTGYKLPAYNPSQYQQAVTRIYYPQVDEKTGERISPEATDADEAFLAERDKELVAIMDRVLSDYRKDAMAYRQIGCNGFRFVTTAHSWPRMVVPYAKTLMAAMDRAGIAEKTYLPKVAFASGQQLSVAG